MAMLSFLSVLLYGKSSWILLNNKYTEIDVHKNTFLTLEAKIIL